MCDKICRWNEKKKQKKQNGETRDIYITKATNEEFHFSCCNCFLSKNGNVSYTIPQSRSVSKHEDM